MTPALARPLLKKHPVTTRPRRLLVQYQEIFCQKLIDYCSGGYSFSAFAATIGVDRHTLAKWAKDHTEFAQARDAAESACDKWFQERTHQMIKGGKGNVVALIWASKNIAKWRDRNEVDATVTTVTESPAEQAARLGAYDKLR